MGNILSSVLEKLGEAYEWLKTKIGEACEWLETKIGTPVLEMADEAFEWQKSKIETLVEYMSRKIVSWLNRARRFWDNFTEQLKEAIVKSKSAIDGAMQKVIKILRSLKSLFRRSSSVQEMKKRIVQLKNLVGSIIKHMLEFTDLMNEVARRTSQRCCKESFERVELSELYDLLTGFVELLKIMQYNPEKLSSVIVEAFSLYLKKLQKTMEEMKYERCYLGKHEKKAGFFVYIYVVLSHLATRFNFTYGTHVYSGKHEKKAGFFVYVMLSHLTTRFNFTYGTHV